MIVDLCGSFDDHNNDNYFSAAAAENRQSCEVVGSVTQVAGRRRAGHRKAARGGIYLHLAHQVLHDCRLDVTLN